MAAAAPVALGLMVAGQLMGAAEESRGLKSAAAVDEENARLSLLSGEQSALDTRREERRATGDTLAAQGASGTLMNTGSNRSIIEQNAYQRELEILNIRTRATRDANNNIQGANEKRKMAKSAIVKGLFGAASTALGGVSDMKQARDIRAQNEKRRKSDWGGYGSGYGGQG